MLAICSDSSVVGWRFNNSGQLGNGNNLSTLVPVHVNSLTNVIAIAGGVDHSLAAKNDGTLWAWGDNGWGELGSTIFQSYVPIQVNSLTGIIAVAAGGGHSVALKNDGTVWAFGQNNLGQLGNGTLTDTHIPVQVNSLSDIIAIAAGQEHYLALKNDSTVWAWGYNEFGQLGNGNNNTSSTPVQVTGLSGVIAIAAGGYAHSVALKSDSTVWTWGINEYGQLGNGTLNNSNIPVNVTSLTSVTKIAGGGGHILAVKSDSTVWSWGAAGANGFTSNSSIPIQVSGLNSITNITAGGQNSLALQNDGTLWAWGDNRIYVFGNGYVGPSSNIPIELTDVCSITTKIEMETLNNNLTLYPNPATTTLTLTTQQTLKNAELKIMNAIGQEVYHSIFDIERSTFDISSLPPGLYYLTLQSEEGVATKKFEVIR
ncbi:MAG: T9SS type A sorting domain-containing protein [Bacteroidia bacterium]